MSEPLLTKRLHISGLTPSLTQQDLWHRLSSFGKVKAMDGFGARDALGDPRKFGFVTMEISAKELAKCLNVLSGSTWKGAKVRIGEAKLDFRERLAQFNSLPPKSGRPKQTHACNHGRPSSTLPLTPLSVTAAASTPGWIVTPSGRIIRPMRMRPERPLEPIRSELSVSKVKGVNGKVKKRAKLPPVRARRRLIDPTKWDSVYLKGVFLDNTSVPLLVERDAPEPSDLAGEEDEEETEKDGTDSDAFSSTVRKEIEPLDPVPQLAQGRTHFIQNAQELREAVLATTLQAQADTEFINVRDETNAALAMLGKMFGERGDWDGRESVDGMGDLEGSETSGKEMHVGEDDVEIVPQNFGEGVQGSNVIKEDKGKGKEKSSKEAHFRQTGGMDLDAAPVHGVEMDGPPAGTEASVQATEPAPQTSLKALFAPREEVSFSLLDHLDIDLDLELDVDILGISAPSSASQDNCLPSESTLPKPQVVQIPATRSTTKARSRVTLDPSLPLLFPPPGSHPHRHTASSEPTSTAYWHGTPACFLFPLATRVRGLHQLPPSVTFTRSPQDTSESIRERWERDKSSLTHEWKKAWREARRSRRGKVGNGGDLGGSF